MFNATNLARGGKVRKPTLVCVLANEHIGVDGLTVFGRGGLGPSEARSFPMVICSHFDPSAICYLGGRGNLPALGREGFEPGLGSALEAAVSVTNRRVNYVVALMLLAWPTQAQSLPPDQACAAIVRTLDDATGHRDSNREAVRRGLIACRLFGAGTPSPAASADPLADIEPNPRGITRGEVEAAIADWCSTHMQAPLCQKLLRR